MDMNPRYMAQPFRRVYDCAYQRGLRRGWIRGAVVMAVLLALSMFVFDLVPRFKSPTKELQSGASEGPK